jgi:hypothetical protein
MNRRAARGFLLPLLFGLFLAVGLVGLLGGRLAAAGAGRTLRDAQSATALAQARAALLGYAALYPESHLRGHPARAAFVPGHLPCPDTGTAFATAGNEAGACGAAGVSVVGRFPWRSLGLPVPRAAGECLWYAVSGHYKSNPKSGRLNADTPGQFEIFAADGQHLLAGKSPMERPVAVLFAPGGPRAGQARATQNADEECGLSQDARAFLERLGEFDNATPDPRPDAVSRLVFGERDDVAGHAAPNDQLLWIYPADIARALLRRPDAGRADFDENFASAPPGRPSGALTQRVAACLARFGDANPWQRLPWAAPLERSGSTPWANTAFADRAGLRSGRPPFSVRASLARFSSSLPALADCRTGAPESACRLLRTDNCPELLPVAGYPTPADGSGQDSPDGLWDNRKDHLFYLVAPGFAPAEAPAADCAHTPDACLWIGDAPYAAAVLFAGERLAGQVRDDEAARMTIGNYLEGENAAAIQSGSLRLERAGNDQIACLAAPDATHPGYRLVANCGRSDCQAAADRLLAAPPGACPDAPGCPDPSRDLAGCACLGAAQKLATPACRTAPASPLCQDARRALRRCV